MVIKRLFDAAAKDYQMPDFTIFSLLFPLGWPKFQQGSRHDQFEIPRGVVLPLYVFLKTRRAPAPLGRDCAETVLA